MKVLPSEKHVQQLFKSRYGIVLKKIDERGGKAGRTSDFEFVIDNRRLFVCELKEFIDVPLSEEYGFAVIRKANGTVVAYKKHNATNRISDAIEDAYDQLSKYSEPKILAILNFSRFMGVEDLVETYKGYRVLGVEKGVTHLDTYARRASEGKIKNIKDSIDLYIWIDSSRKGLAISGSQVFFRTATETGKRIREKFFGKSSIVTQHSVRPLHDGELQPMNKLFTPSFQHFQKDIERHLKSEGKYEKNEHGQAVYRGYPAAVEGMFRTYLEQEAFSPLVAEFRTWNWEWGYNDYLLDLTARLRETGNWSLLRELWGAVIAKRRTNYNKTLKAHRALPEKIPESLVTKTRELLLDSLYRLRNYAAELQQSSAVTEYLEMIAKVEKGIRA